MARMTRTRFRPSRAIAYLRDEEKKAAEERAKSVAADLSESGGKALDLIRQAVADALENGESLEEFRKRFDVIAAKTGWDPKGGRNHRSRIIYQTNLRVARQAGRWSQMQEMKEEAPFWQYRHGGSAQPRKEHLEWDGLILHADHPWWQTHYPPNGFGCSCRVVPLDAEGVKRQWKKAGGEGEPPELTPESGGIVFDRGTRGQRENPRLWTPPDPEQDGIPVEVNGKLVRVPRGIDPGWDYVPQLSPEAEEAARKERETAAAETETPTAEQVQQPEPQTAPETPAPEPQKPEPEPTPAEDDAETKRRALLDALSADLAHALEELRGIARDKERDLRAQNLATEALDAALKELRERLEEAENEAKQAHEKAVQRALKVEFAEDDDPDGVRQYLAQALGTIVRQLKDARFNAAKVTLGQAAEANRPLLTETEVENALRSKTFRQILATPEKEAEQMKKWAGALAAAQAAKEEERRKNPNAPERPDTPEKPYEPNVNERHYWKSMAKLKRNPKTGKKHIVPAFSREENTIVLPGTPCKQDLKDINAGLAVKTKIKQTEKLQERNRETGEIIKEMISKEVEVFIINGRAYWAHPTTNEETGEEHDTLMPYPVSGAGLFFLNRSEYAALAYIVGTKKLLGYYDIDLALWYMRNNKIDKNTALKVLRVWGAIQKAAEQEGEGEEE